MWGPISATQWGISSDPSIKANILNDYFASVFTNEQNDLNIPGINYDQSVPQMEPVNINQQEVYKLLNSLRSCKAGGPDNIPAKFLKEFASFLAPSLTFLYEASLYQGKLPSD